jgi:hypothetical protein
MYIFARISMGMSRRVRQVQRLKWRSGLERPAAWPRLQRGELGQERGVMVEGLVIQGGRADDESTASADDAAKGGPVLRLEEGGRNRLLL